MSGYKFGEHYNPKNYELVPKLKIVSPILVFKIINLDTGYENNFEKLGKVGFGIASIWITDQIVIKYYHSFYMLFCSLIKIIYFV